MPGTMSKADLIADLKASLNDAQNAFTAAADADFERHLAIAAQDMARKRPLTQLGEIAVTAEESAYSAPADMRLPKSPLWGVNEQRRRWRSSYPGTLPRLTMSGSTLYLMPAPTAEQIALLGSSYKFWYFANYVIDADAANTTVATGDRGLLLLRAQAEAMKELSLRQVAKPVMVAKGTGATPAVGTAAAVYKQLIEEFEAAA